MRSRRPKMHGRCNVRLMCLDLWMFCPTCRRYANCAFQRAKSAKDLIIGMHGALHMQHGGANMKIWARFASLCCISALILRQDYCKGSIDDAFISCQRSPSFEAMHYTCVVCGRILLARFLQRIQLAGKIYNTCLQVMNLPTSSSLRMRRTLHDFCSISLIALEALLW